MSRLFAGLPSDRILPASDNDWTVDGMQPSIVIRPLSIDEVSNAVRLASENGLAVIPRGSGSLLDLGNRPSGYDVALDLTGLDAIVDYSPDDLVVTVQAGMTLGELNRVLAERGQFLALDPPLADQATVGGALAANLSGPSRLRYGTARDLVIGMTCILPSGTRVHSGGRVVKNVAGYDLNKLYVGAIGTLGLILEVSFKLHPLPASRAAIVAIFPDFEAAHRAGMEIVNSSLGAIAVEIAGREAAERLDIPQAAHGESVLFISLAGLPRAVERQTTEIGGILQTRGARTNDALDANQCGRTHAALRDLGRAGEQAALLLRCNLQPADLPSALRRLEESSRITEAAVTASPGSGNLRLIWFQLPGEPLALIDAIRREIRALGGNTVVERCSCDLKASLDIWDVDGTDVVLMREMKSAYDPTGTLSPGRFVNQL